MVLQQQITTSSISPTNIILNNKNRNNGIGVGLLGKDKDNNDDG